MSVDNIFPISLSCDINNRVKFSFESWTLIQSKILKHIIVEYNEEWYEILGESHISKIKNMLEEIGCNGLKHREEFIRMPSIFCNKKCKANSKCHENESLGGFREKIIQICINAIRNDKSIMSKETGRCGRHGHNIKNGENNLYLIPDEGFIIIFIRPKKLFFIKTFYFPLLQEDRVSAIYKMLPKTEKIRFMYYKALKYIKKDAGSYEIHYEETFLQT